MPYLLLFVGILLLIFSVLLLNIAALSRLDLLSMQWLSEYRTQILNQIAQSLSVIGGMPFVLFLSTLWCISLLWYKKYASVIFICIGVIGGILLAWLLKFVIARPRPPASFHLVESFGSSFPSAHSLYAACLSCLAIYIYRQHSRHTIIIMIAVGWLLIMGISRVYLGVHFPSDVISGWSISFIWISLWYMVWIRYCTILK
ncbi:phosphatase PAP2 family protein [Acinetobacter sp. RF15A]|uniref:phosphatase PAP2 family protein n=1 Tax=unclassified Acinetobacter TaxID=196816 RepID=UPI0011901F62|nr:MULTISPECIES: phosphatase PAP2 family protein [unclassified Acinetobacter]TSH70852.1 phosphatase PAP2 family protein [Acinetobacter sp. RF15A]TSI21037.1 phosphatase PAP2 family protein [Acinetobacter sp. RF15B]